MMKSIRKQCVPGRCTCDMRLEHSYVLDTRFHYLKRKEHYEKTRNRQCTVCNRRFVTIEIDKYEKDS